ncbi:2287_t:CDS:1, partial [Cetraspora pellucida]
ISGNILTVILEKLNELSEKINKINRRLSDMDERFLDSFDLAHQTDLQYIEM